MIASNSEIFKNLATFSSDNINYIIALITMQIPLCIYVLDKSSGVLKYSFVKKAFYKKTKVILITRFLLILLFANVAYAIILKKSILAFFMILIVEIALTVLIFIEYSTIINNIASFNEIDTISIIILSAIEDCTKKEVNLKSLNEIFKFVISNENNQYCTLLLNKLNKLKKNDDKRLGIALSNYVSHTFSEKYGYLMNYTTYKTIYDENIINQLIVNSVNDLQKIEILRNVSLGNKEYSNFSFYQYILTCYIGNVHAFYYEHNVDGRYNEQIKNSFNYFDKNIGVFLWCYDIAHYTLPNIFEYLKFLLCCGDNDSIELLLLYFRRLGETFDIKTKSEILYFYLCTIEAILWAKKITKADKIKHILHIKHETMNLFDSTNLENYISMLYQLLNANKFNILIDKIYFEDNIDISIIDILGCSYSWLQHHYDSFDYNLFDKQDLSVIESIKNEIYANKNKYELLNEYGLLKHNDNKC